MRTLLLALLLAPAQDVPGRILYEDWSEIFATRPDGSDAAKLRAGEDPSASADGKTIVFTSFRTRNYELYLWDGSELRRLTETPELEFSPALSPDARRVAFVRAADTDASPDIWVMDADGSGARNLTRHPKSDGGPAWSPDGRRLAFHSNRDGKRSIYVMDADGSGVRKVMENGGEPAWSPDGERIAFVSDRDDGHFEDLYVMDADGSNVVRLTSTPIAESSPSWSPDGKRLAFGAVSKGLWVVNADGSGLKKIKDAAKNPVWTAGP